MMAAMNELSNHDHSRFLTRTNRQVGRLDYRGKAAASEGINLGIFRGGGGGPDDLAWGADDLLRR